MNESEENFISHDEVFLDNETNTNNDTVINETIEDTNTTNTDNTITNNTEENIIDNTTTGTVEEVPSVTLETIHEDLGIICSFIILFSVVFLIHIIYKFFRIFF